eukprot:TRINITY_DN7359_c0_g4_i1.p1 TRINITY_DN7359_c0_g4~~TRINITY_DN7359_c0_g4_i1.p1  ORF type:complete len:258 (-),score=42.75 TRINITY_DN7359_c0_g4_i1:87-758(-)
MSRPVRIGLLLAALEGNPSNSNDVELASISEHVGSAELGDGSDAFDNANADSNSTRVTEHISPRPDVLVLVTAADEKQLVHVYGVVEKQKLRERLSNSASIAEDVLCSFKDLQEPLEDGAGAEQLIDLTDLVMTDVRRMLASTPLLTAVCAFREYQDLEYCVCRCDVATGLSVLSRSHLEKALTETRFAMAFCNKSQGEDTDTSDGSKRVLRHRNNSSSSTSI